MIFITIIEIIYLYYMFHVLRTQYSFNHPFEYLFTNDIDDYFKHSIGIEDPSKSKICKFGRDGSLILIAYLIFRYLLIKTKLIPENKFYNFNNCVLLFIFIVSWMNLNAVIYFLPFLLFDWNYFYN